VAVKCKIRLVEAIVFTEATVLKTTEVTASVASNVAMALLQAFKLCSNKIFQFLTVGVS